MSYRRVVPRDLFNEAKLLKCLGRLALFIQTGKCPGLTLDEESVSDGFFVQQSEADGSLFVINLTFCFHDQPLNLLSSYNSKETYPLVVRDLELGDRIVFDAAGNFHGEFLDFMSKRRPTYDPG